MDSSIESLKADCLFYRGFYPKIRPIQHPISQNDITMTETDLEIAPQYDLSAVVIPLLKGVIYQENGVTLWGALLNLLARVRDYVAVLGLELVLDDAEGYALLRLRRADTEEADKARLMAEESVLCDALSDYS